MPSTTMDTFALNNKGNKIHITYAGLIALALHTSETGALRTSQIYNFVRRGLPFVQSKSTKGFENSVRHNLSMRSSFYQDHATNATDVAASTTSNSTSPGAGAMTALASHQSGAGTHTSSSGSSPQTTGRPSSRRSSGNGEHHRHGLGGLWRLRDVDKLPVHGKRLLGLYKELESTTQLSVDDFFTAMHLTLLSNTGTPRVRGCVPIIHHPDGTTELASRQEPSTKSPKGRKSGAGRPPKASGKRGSAASMRKRGASPLETSTTKPAYEHAGSPLGENSDAGSSSSSSGEGRSDNHHHHHHHHHYHNHDHGHKQQHRRRGAKQKGREQPQNEDLHHPEADLHAVDTETSNNSPPSGSHSSPMQSPPLHRRASMASASQSTVESPAPNVTCSPSASGASVVNTTAGSHFLPPMHPAFNPSMMHSQLQRMLFFQHQQNQQNQQRHQSGGSGSGGSDYGDMNDLGANAQPTKRAKQEPGRRAGNRRSGKRHKGSKTPSNGVATGPMHEEHERQHSRAASDDYDMSSPTTMAPSAHGVGTGLSTGAIRGSAGMPNAGMAQLPFTTGVPSTSNFLPPLNTSGFPPQMLMYSTAVTQSPATRPHPYMA